MCDPGAGGAREQPLVAVLWGRDASTLKPMLEADDCVVDRVAASVAAVGVAGILRLAAVQPPNELLEKMGAEPIDWRLP